MQFPYEEQIIEAIEFGHKYIKIICDALTGWQKEIGKEKVRDALKLVPQATLDAVESLSLKKVESAVRIISSSTGSSPRCDPRRLCRGPFTKEGEEPLHVPSDIDKAYKKVKAKVMRQMVLNENIRCDGRTTTEIRPNQHSH